MTDCPAFILPTTGGQVFDSTAWQGRFLVLYFYPKDNTPGCTAEGSDFRDLFPGFAAVDAKILGISRDSLASHERFKARQQFPFDLAADPDETVCPLFGVMKLKNMYGKQVRGIERSTFVIAASGRILRAWRGVRVPGHAQEVLAYLSTC